jgi:hypothetical protein
MPTFQVELTIESTGTFRFEAESPAKAKEFVDALCLIGDPYFTFEPGGQFDWPMTDLTVESEPELVEPDTEEAEYDQP